MEQLDDLYREVIVDHYRRPRHRGRLESPDVSAAGANPLCGDEVAIDVRLADGRIADVGFEGQGCSISQASASMLTELMVGKTIAEAEAALARFKEMMVGEEDVSAAELGDVEALSGVKKFPVRIKCATLAWNTLQQGLARYLHADSDRPPEDEEAAQAPETS